VTPVSTEWYLEVRAGDTLGELFEQRLHHLLKLGRFNDVKYLLQLIQIHHLHHVSSTSPVRHARQSQIAHFAPTHHNYLVIITKQNLIGIDAVVSAVTLPESE